MYIIFTLSGLFYHNFLDWSITNNTVVYVDEQRMLRSDCTDAFVDQALHCLWHEGLFGMLSIIFLVSLNEIKYRLTWTYVVCI